MPTGGVLLEQPTLQYVVSDIAYEFNEWWLIIDLGGDSGLWCFYVVCIWSTYNLVR